MLTKLEPVAVAVARSLIWPVAIAACAGMFAWALFIGQSRNLWPRMDK